MARELQLFPGDPIHDADEFLARKNRFTPDVTATKNLRELWRHGNLTTELLGKRALQSVRAHVVGEVPDGTDFALPLERRVRDATIHLPGSDYSVPEWGAHFEPIIRTIVDYENDVNPDANNQIMQMRYRRYNREIDHESLPHIDMINSDVRDFHLYLVTDTTPTETFEGEFTYDIGEFDSAETQENPLPFYQHLDRQFRKQVGKVGIQLYLTKPYDITLMTPNTVHRRPIDAPDGRTLLAVQTYNVVS